MTVVDAPAGQRVFSSESGVCDKGRVHAIGAAARVAALLLGDTELREDLRQFSGLGPEQLLNSMQGIVPELPLEVHRRVLIMVIEHRLHSGSASGMLAVADAEAPVPGVVANYVGRFEQLSRPERATVQFALLAQTVCDRLSAQLQVPFVHHGVLPPLAQQLQAESPAFIREVVVRLPHLSEETDDWFQQAA